jgi:hypothetical protein
VDFDGRLWLERPRADRAGVSNWDIIGRNGRQVAEFAAPRACRLMAIAGSRLLCQFGATDTQALPRLATFAFTED